MAKIVSKAVNLELSKHSYGVIIYILNKYIHSKTHKYHVQYIKIHTNTSEICFRLISLVLNT